MPPPEVATRVSAADADISAAEASYLTLAPAGPITAPSTPLPVQSSEAPIEQPAAQSPSPIAPVAATPDAYSNGAMVEDFHQDDYISPEKRDYAAIAATAADAYGSPEKIADCPVGDGHVSKLAQSIDEKADSIAAQVASLKGPARRLQGAGFDVDEN